MNFQSITNELWNDFISNLFPLICVNCRETLVRDEVYICTKCKLSLPRTNLHIVKENRLFQKFAFEPKVKFVTAFLEYNPGGIARKLIHQLKYKGEQELGTILGDWFGLDLLQAPIDPDLILPVPLHPKKLRIRGYNQSDCIARGISERMGVLWDPKILSRTVFTKTQTKKSKIDRWKNVDSIFSINTHGTISNKKVLLVDDVLTTGATLGSLASILSSAGVSEIYIATLAAGA